MKAHHLPMPAQWALYLAMRTLVGVPLIAGTGPSVRAADSFGTWFANASFNRKRFERAVRHARVAFPDESEEFHRSCAEGAYRHLLRTAVETAFAPRRFTADGWARHVDIGSVGSALSLLQQRKPLLLITGHCGNWEVLGATMALLGYPMHAVYRPLDLKPLDAWVRRTRAAHGLELVSKFGAIYRLPECLERGEPVGFVADQNGGDRGIFTPFFGRLGSSYKAIALLALQFDASIAVGQAQRVRGGSVKTHDTAVDPDMRFTVDVVDTFGPEDYRSQPDPAFYITARYRRAIETMVRNRPQDYLWMHRSWKSRPPHERQNKPFPDKLREKLLSLPWMTEAEVRQLVEQSDRDRATLAELGVDRLP